MPKRVEKKDEIPETLQPYYHFGIDLNWDGRNKNATGECPWCGRDNKFAVTVDTGQFRCWGCGEGTDKGGGNLGTFFSLLIEKGKHYTKEVDYEALTANRGLFKPACLKRWQVVRSVINDDWIYPGYSQSGSLITLYKWNKKAFPPKRVKNQYGGHGLHGMNLYRKTKKYIYLCEGFWDGVAWWEALKYAKELDKCNVLAIPGCQVFMDKWLPLFKNKVVTIMYDNDHPRTNEKTGEVRDADTVRALKRVASCIHTVASEVKFLRWGKEGETYNPEYPSGTDIRDFLAGKV